MGVDQPARDEQAEPEAAGAPGGRLVSLAEALEDVGKKRRHRCRGRCR